MLKYIFFLLFLLCNHALASQTDFDFHITQDFQYANIAPFVETYGDTTLKQDFEYVLNNEAQLPFEINGRQSLHKSITNAIWWVRFPIKNYTDEAQQLLLEIGNQDLNQLQLFILRGDSVQQSILTGDAFPFEQRPIQHRHFLFPFELQPNEATVCYLMSNKHSESYVMPIELWKKQAFLESDTHQSLWSGLYLGALILYMLIPLLLLFSFRKKIMVYYFLLTLSFTTYILVTHGFGFQFLWPNAPSDINKIIRPSVTVFIFLFLSLFVIEFSKNRTAYPKLLKALVFGKNTILLLLPITIPISFIFIETVYSQRVNNFLLQLEFVLFFSLFVIIIVISFLDFYKTRKFHFFGIGFVCLLHVIIFIIVMMNLFGKINSGPDFHNIMLINVGTEFVILSIILFVEYRTLFSKKQDLEKEHLRQELAIVNTLLNSQKEERSRIGVEIKDNLQFFIAQSQDALRQATQSASPTPALQKIEELLALSQEETQRISHNLSSINFSLSASNSIS